MRKILTCQLLKLQLISQCMFVKEVISFSENQDFLNFPKKLYKNNPDWVCPLDKDIEEIFDPSLNRNFENGEAKRWLLLDDSGKIIGRIAAFYTHKSLVQPDIKSGGIGFFECIHDQHAANILFDKAKTWLQEIGFEAMDGPINFGERDKFWGLLVQGFKNPSYQENFNFPYYRELFETYGFKQIFEQTTSEINFDLFKKDRLEKPYDRVSKNPAYSFEHFKMNQLEKFSSDFIEIYNKAWEKRIDFEPLTQKRMETTLHSIKPILIEEGIWFAYANNEPAGFFVNVIDVNQIFKHLNGKLDLWGKIKFVWFKKFGNVNRIRGIVFGVVPKYQNLGLETAMIMKVFNSMKKFPKIQSAELSWIGDFNPKMHSLFNAVGAKSTKIHYTYRLIWDKKSAQ